MQGYKEYLIKNYFQNRKNMLFSIITVNRNNSEGLARTISSVKSLNKKNYEFIIIDGASTDNSLKILESNKEFIDYYVSEPDNGIYNAMNKGINIAKGEYVIFMNSGDAFIEGNVLEKLEAEDLHSDFIFCGWMRSRNGQAIKSYAPEENITLYKLLRRSACVCHQATFIRRTTLLELGNYDESLVICADICFVMIALVLHNKTYQISSVCTTLFDITGISGSDDGEKIINKEKYDYFKEKFPYLYDDYLELHNRIRFTIPNIIRFLKWRFSKDR